MDTIARRFQLAKLLLLLVMCHNASAENRYRLTLTVETLPEISLLSASVPARKDASSNHHMLGSASRHHLVQRLGIAFDGANRVGVLRYRNMENQHRYGFGVHYKFGRKDVDAIVTRAGMLVKTEYRKMQINLGYRSSSNELAGGDSAVYLAIGKVW